MAKRGLVSIIVIVAIVVVFLVIVSGWYIGTRNRLVTLEESISASWAEIDNQLKRRADLIPNLVATVRGFATQEREVFTQIAEARAKLAGAQTVGEAAASYNQLQSALGRLLVIVERYPELKSNQNFIRLQDELAGTENRIAVARKRYNDSVRVLNTKIRRFPSSIVANMMGFEKKEYFEIEEGAREVPQVDFES
ncbi:MAG: LemA family protein [Spirochaetes bacterium DG_61]|jgi:LemA protein|nr:MAG: LemA family protein [Spirochaetes bacterium DG_61]